MPDARFRSVIDVVVVLALLSAGAITGDARAERQSQLPRQLARQSWTVGGVERTAIVASPTAQSPAGAPLVLVFHGHGGTSAHSARTFDIHSRWPEAVVIYAQGLPSPGLKTDPEGLRPGWQQAPGAQGDRDLKYVDAMIAWARTRFTIDGSRIYACGHSNGGTMTFVLWAARGDVFAAFAPSASVFRRDLIASAKPKPALIIAGELDQLVPFAAQQSSLAAVLSLDRAARTGEPWSGRALRHPSPIGADVVAYIHPGDHTMPDDAGAMMVQFFKQSAGKSLHHEAH
jgi:polyhydroxybutyrate depolymerase